jgi:RND family efflux transporter MFP subunit
VVYKPIVKKISESESFLANLQAMNQPQISSKLSGYLKKIYVRESDAVKKGDLLAELDLVDVKAAINQQQNALDASIFSKESLKANFSVAVADLNLAKESVERNRALYEIGGIAKESYDNSLVMLQSKKAKVLASKKAIEAKQKEISSLKEALKVKQNQATYAQIVSPIDGVVGDIFIKEGSLSAPGKPIMNIISNKKRVIFSYAPNTPIKIGQKVEIEGFSEEITAIYDNSKNGLTTAEIALKNDIKMPIGSSVNIKVLFKSAKGVAVPLNALLHDEDVSVMVYNGDMFEKQRVDVVVEDDNFAVISPSISKPVAVGSESKLSSLLALQNIRVVFDEK